jgi:hypothetical protein
MCNIVRNNEMKPNLNDFKKDAIIGYSYGILDTLLIRLKSNSIGREIIIHELESSLAILEREIDKLFYLRDII